MNFDRRELTAVFAGGVIGTLARVGLTQLFVSGDASWPWAVFAINISGCLLLGYLVTQLQERLPLSPAALATRVCGADPTFSTMQLELLNMWNAHRFGLVAAYLGASVICGYIAVHVSTAVTRGVRVGS